jgi:hypothetical protein
MRVVEVKPQESEYESSSESSVEEKPIALKEV